MVRLKRNLPYFFICLIYIVADNCTSIKSIRMDHRRMSLCLSIPWGETLVRKFAEAPQTSLYNPNTARVKVAVPVRFKVVNSHCYVLSGIQVEPSGILQASFLHADLSNKAPVSVKKIAITSNFSGLYLIDFTPDMYGNIYLVFQKDKQLPEEKNRFFLGGNNQFIELHFPGEDALIYQEIRKLIFTNALYLTSKSTVSLGLFSIDVKTGELIKVFSSKGAFDIFVASNGNLVVPQRQVGNNQNEWGLYEQPSGKLLKSFSNPNFQLQTAVPLSIDDNGNGYGTNGKNIFWMNFRTNEIVEFSSMNGQEIDECIKQEFASWEIGTDGSIYMPVQCKNDFRLYKVF